MKTKIAILIVLVALIVCNITLAKADNGAVELSKVEVGDINKLEVSGNVDVYLVNGDYDAVKVYDDYYGENALIQNDGGVLRIASYATEKLVVFVTVDDLKEITANNNAAIRSYGDALAAKGIEITLNDEAVAQLKIDAIGAQITVNDQARAEFAGSIQNYELNYTTEVNVNNDNLLSYAIRESKIEQPKPVRRGPMAFRMHASL